MQVKKKVLWDFVRSYDMIRCHKSLEDLHAYLKVEIHATMSTQRSFEINKFSNLIFEKAHACACTLIIQNHMMSRR